MVRNACGIPVTLVNAVWGAVSPEAPITPVSHPDHTRITFPAPQGYTAKLEKGANYTSDADDPPDTCTFLYFASLVWRHSYDVVYEGPACRLYPKGQTKYKISQRLPFMLYNHPIKVSAYLLAVSKYDLLQTTGSVGNPNADNLEKSRNIPSPTLGP